MITPIAMDIVISIPSGSYTQIMPCSSMAMKHLIDCKAGVIDSDYQGSIKVLLHNMSTISFQIHRGDHIAQLILKHINTPPVSLTPTISNMT